MKKSRTNILFKIIYILFILTIIGFILNNYVFAGISLPANMIVTRDPSLNPIMSNIFWVAQVIFYAAAVIIVMFAGVKFMTAAPEGKAEMKKKFIYMSVGAVMLFAAGGIVTIISNFALNNIK